MRIAFVGPGDNPLASAWLCALRALPRANVVHCDTTDELIGGPHQGLGYGIDGVQRVPYAEVSRAEDYFLGSVDVIFLWWGYRAAAWRDATSTRWPNASVILCLDTLPDASWWPGEIKEWIALRKTRTHGLIFASHRMQRDAFHHWPWMRAVASAVIPVAFPRQAFARKLEDLPRELRLDPSDGLRICFTGRADHLWTLDRRMRKDAVGDALEQLSNAGAEVWLSGLNTDVASASLRWRFMPSFSNADIMNGTMATYLSQFDASFIGYRTHNRTIRRRVGNGLSTRLALALTFPSVWIVDTASWDVCSSLWRDEPWGVTMCDRDAPNTLEAVQAILGTACSAWLKARPNLEMEAYHQALLSLLERSRILAECLPGALCVDSEAVEE